MVSLYWVLFIIGKFLVGDGVGCFYILVYGIFVMLEGV